jgi:two-component system, OmpR family, sensor kinase
MPLQSGFARRWRSIRRAPGGGSLRQLPGRIPLRIKLITALLALVAIALIVISSASVSVLRSYLQGRADSQVTAQYNSIVAELAQPGSRIPMAGGFTSINGFPYITEIRNSRGFILRPFGFEPPSSYEPAVPTDPAWLGAHSGHLVTVPSYSGTDSWRIIARQVPYPVVNPASGAITSRTGALIVGADIGDINGTAHRLADIDIIVSAIVLLGLAIVGVAIVGSSLRPLTDIERTAAAIAAGDLSRRVPDRDPVTEVGRLGRALNTMLAQIEAAFVARAESEAAARRSEERMRRFVADASHELRTPLTAIRGYAEYYRQRGGLLSARPAGDAPPTEAPVAAPVPGTARMADAASRPAAAPCGATGTNKADRLSNVDMDRIMERVEQEAARMGMLVEDMLLLARVDQQRPMERRPVDLLSVAADAVQDARMIAPTRTIELNVAAGAAFLVHGDEARLRQVVGNLMGNALTHTPDGTPIDVRIRAADTPGDPPVPAVTLEVADQGPGLTAEQAERAFERFYRADQARRRRTGGTGLGLAIVSALVTAHGGTVGVDTAPGKGATFRITLPLAPEAQEQPRNA